MKEERKIKLQLHVLFKKFKKMKEESIVRLLEN